jgi:hypothetical protein
VGHIHEIHGKYGQSAQTRKRKADSTKAQQAKAHSTTKSGPSTDVDEAQAHLGTDHAKAVARRAHQGCGPTLVAAS